MELNTMNVREVLVYLMLKEHELMSSKPEVNPIYVEGVYLQFNLHPYRVKEKEKEIEELLEQLPDVAKVPPGKTGGVSLPKLCFNHRAVQWGTSLDVDFLLCLGLAIKKVTFPLPREMWRSLPKGMPYVVVQI